VRDALAPADAVEERLLLPSRSGGNSIVIGRPDRLVGRVAEQPLGGGVPRQDHALERLADDGVVGRLDDRRQVSLRLLARVPGVARVAEALVLRGQRRDFDGQVPVRLRSVSLIRHATPRSPPLPHAQGDVRSQVCGPS
jgi:hypothetical protein